LKSGVSVEKSRFTTRFLSLLVSWLFALFLQARFMQLQAAGLAYG
jgi:hypothetical protein